LGLELELPAESAGDAAPFIDLLLSLRQDLRAAKQWALADKIRDQLLELGITIEDQASGSIWRAT
jgi:cysteinyl-tRNA synthetase